MSLKKSILRQEKQLGGRSLELRRKYNSKKFERLHPNASCSTFLSLMGGAKSDGDVEKTLSLAERVQAATAKYLSMIDKINRQKQGNRVNLSSLCKKRKKTVRKGTIPTCESDRKCVWKKFKGCFPNPNYFSHMSTTITWKDIEKQADLIDRLKQELDRTKTSQEIKKYPRQTVSIYNKIVHFMNNSWNMGMEWLSNFRQLIQSLMRSKYTYIIGLASYIVYCYFYGGDCYGQEHLFLLWNTITGESVAEPMKQGVKSWWGLGGTAVGMYGSHVAYTSLCGFLGPGAPVCVAGAIAWNVQITSAIAFGAFGSELFGSTIGEAHGEAIKQSILREYMTSMQNGFTLISAYIMNNPEIVTAIGISTATALKYISFASLTASLKANYHGMRGNVFGKMAKTHVKMISAVAPATIAVPMQQVMDATVDEGGDIENCGIRLKTRTKMVDGERIPRCEDPPKKCKWVTRQGCKNI